MTSRLLVHEALRQWRHGRTTIVITHDLTPIGPDDFIYLLRDGQVVENGYRRDLEAADGAFRQMADVQARRGPDEPAPAYDDEAALDALVEAVRADVPTPHAQAPSLLSPWLDMSRHSLMPSRQSLHRSTSYATSFEGRAPSPSELRLQRSVSDMALAVDRSESTIQDASSDLSAQALERVAERAREGRRVVRTAHADAENAAAVRIEVEPSEKLPRMTFWRFIRACPTSATVVDARRHLLPADPSQVAPLRRPIFLRHRRRFDPGLLHPRRPAPRRPRP